MEHVTNVAFVGLMVLLLGVLVLTIIGNNGGGDGYV